MSDRLTIIGRNGKPRYIVDEFNQIADLLHEHAYVEGICACGQTEEISPNADQTPETPE